MQLDRKTLAFLQLPATKGDLYVPASGSKGLVHILIFHNTNTTAESVVLNYHDGTSEHEIFSQSIAAGATITWTFKGSGDIVEDGGKYTGNTTTASKVTLKVCGTEETPGLDTYPLAAGEDSNLWVRPSTPHAYDDEFEASTLAGWTGVQNVSDDAVGSLSYGTVDAYDTTFNAGNVVRVNVNDPARPSWLQIQVPSRDKQYAIYKAITIPTNLLVVARLKFNMKLNYPADDASVFLALVEATGGVPVSDSRVELHLQESDVSVQAQSQVIDSGGTPGTATNTTSTVNQGQALEYVAIHKIGTTFHTWVGTASGNWIWLTSYGSLGFTPDMVCVGGTNNSVSSPGVAVVGVDFVRFFETDNFLL